MHCEQIREQFADYLAGTLRGAERAEVERHIAGCSDCESAIMVWNRLGDLSMERPRPEMKSRFQDLLWANAGAEPSRVVRPARLPVWTWAIAAGLLVAGFLGGRLAHGPTESRESRPEEVASLRQEVRSLREAVIVSMLRQQSASDRLKGVLTSTTLNRPDGDVTKALIDTLRRDPNVNVRLAAVDALKRFSGDETVRSGFVGALSANDSPLVQIALIDALVELRDPQATPALRELQSASQVDDIVKQRAKLALERLGSPIQ